MAVRNLSQDLLHRALSRALTVAIGLGALAGVILLQRARMATGMNTGLSPQQLEQQEILQAKALKNLPSQGFGFNQVIADWVFLRFLQYSGDDEARKVTGYAASPEMFEVITRRDPRFVDTYVFASGTVGYELGMPEKSIEFLTRGIEKLDPTKHRDAHRVLVLKGMDELLLLGDTLAAAGSYETAAKWAAQSPDPEVRQEAKRLGEISDFLRTNPDPAPVKFWSWNMIFAQAVALKNPKTEARAREELLAMGGIESKNAEGQTVFLPPAPKSPTPNTAVKPDAKAKSAPAPDNTSPPSNTSPNNPNNPNAKPSPTAASPQASPSPQAKPPQPTN